MSDAPIAPRGCVTCHFPNHTYRDCRSQCAHCDNYHNGGRCSHLPHSTYLDTTSGFVPVQYQGCITCGSPDHAYVDCRSQCVHCGNYHNGGRCSHLSHGAFPDTPDDVFEAAVRCARVRLDRERAELAAKQRYLRDSEDLVRDYFAAQESGQD